MNHTSSKWPGIIQCLLCKDIIVSNHRHDFVKCTCGESFVDGGYDYLRYGSVSLKNVRVLRISKMPKRKN